MHNMGSITDWFECCEFDAGNAPQWEAQQPHPISARRGCTYSLA
jgi:hypothetical protein